MASLVPGLDTVTDLAAIPVDIMRGDYMSALFDLVGVIPGIGELGDTAKLTRMGIKAAETADDVVDAARAVKTADNIVDAVKAVETADDVVDAAKVAETADDVYDAAKAVETADDIAKNMVNTNELIGTHSLTKSKKQFQELLDDIKINGIQEPIKFVEYNGKKYVVDGHHRLRAARMLGLENIPIEKVELPYKGYSAVEDLFWDK